MGHLKSHRPVLALLCCEFWKWWWRLQVARLIRHVMEHSPVTAWWNFEGGREAALGGWRKEEKGKVISLQEKLIIYLWSVTFLPFSSHCPSHLHSLHTHTQHRQHILTNYRSEQNSSSLFFLSPLCLMWVDTPYALSIPQWVCFSELHCPMMLIVLAAQADRLQPVGGLWPPEGLIAKHSQGSSLHVITGHISQGPERTDNVR